MNMIAQSTSSRPELPARHWFRARSGNWCSKAADRGLIVIFERRGSWSIMHKAGGGIPWPNTFSTLRFDTIGEAKDEASAFERRTLAAIRRRA